VTRRPISLAQRPGCGRPPGGGRRRFVLLAIALLAISVLPAKARAAARVERSGDVLVVHDDGTILPPAEPLPLAGWRLRFVPAMRGGYATQLAPMTTPATRAAAAWRTGRSLSFDDGMPVAIDLERPLPLFGGLRRRVFVHPSGAISLDAPFSEGQRPRASSSGDLLRSLASGPPAVAALWNELLPGRSGEGAGVWVEDREDALAVAWVGVPSVRPAGEPNTFRIVLHRDGRIDLEYAEMATTWGLVGITPGRDASKTTLVDFAGPQRGHAGEALLAWYRDLPVLDEVALSHAVFAAIPDRVQFLTAFTDREVDGPSPVHGIAVKNLDRGLGLPLFDRGTVFGAHNLEHVVVMNDLDFWDDDPSRPPRQPAYAYAPSTLAVLAHEAGHRWLAEASTPEGPLGTDGHWSFFLDSGGSLVGGNRLQDGGDGSFSTGPALDGFGPLDLYLMGLLPAEQVPPMRIVEEPTDFEPPISASGRPFDASSRPEAGVAFRGRARRIAIEDVVRATGERLPRYGEAPRNFRMAFAIVVPDGGEADPALVAKVERVRHAFGTFFQVATGGTGRMGTSLPLGETTTPPAADPSLLAGEPQLLAAEVRPRGSSRWALKIEFADLGQDLTSVELQPDAPGSAPTVVEVTTAAYGARLGAMTLSVRDLPPDVRALRVSLVDRRGQRSHVATRWLPGRS